MVPTYTMFYGSKGIYVQSTKLRDHYFFYANVDAKIQERF